ncbi:TBC1 domain family member 10A isoform X1 [Salmo salar]|uniref:TBC1 domain family member 10A-like isoform X1 n=1 Tax=Salmo salar TaxID=8030 RepID=A0A1S3S388_SALSA|nr:TBC1 domain family member 10A-like isoform X1 [Salmo salar]XP_045576104.1 TBC1 domain family member 10A-like isoform X1 [Salmo salar]
MAEISALIPSPPAIGDTHAAPSFPIPSTAPPPPSSSTPEPPKENPIPKSSLYGDKASLTLTVPGETLPSHPPSPKSPKRGGRGPPPSPPKRVSSALTPETPVPSPLIPPERPAPFPVIALDTPAIPPVDVVLRQREGVKETDMEAVLAVKQEVSNPGGKELLNAPSEGPTQAHSEQEVQGVTQQTTSPSSCLNLTPNLYPSVHVTVNTNPATDYAQPQSMVESPPPPDSTQAAAAPEAQNPQPPEESQNPHPNPQPPPKLDTPSLSPIPETSSQSPRRAELPNTPSRAGHPSPPVIQEPVSLSLPYPRAPAPDTLSYLESASMMSGTLESLSGLGEDGSSIGSDSEINGLAVRRTDKYGFLGGTQYSEGRWACDKDIRVDVARQRELKWLDMFNNWDKWISRRFQKVKLRCRKGIPSSLRAKAWQLLSNSKELLDSNPGKFEELEREQGDPKWLDIIEKDLHRQFPFHEMFAARGGHGQQDLYRVLKAYTVYRPEEGYCQAQAPVAAVLLMHMPAEHAFWCLVQICETYLPGYYSAGLEAIQLDGEIFFSLLRRVCPMAYRHLKKFKIDPILYMTEWFMCVFSRTLPWSCVLRVWDMFFCEGVKIVFRVGLVLLKQMLGSVDKLREVQGMYETMERLRNIPPESVREDLLVQEVVSLAVTEALIERECSIQVRKWRESRGELTHQPVRRLHGTRDIHEHKRRASAISSGGSFSFLGSIPPPGPLRASSSLLSLPGFRKSKTPFHSQKKGSFSGASGMEAMQRQNPSHKPPMSSGSVARAPASQSPLVGSGPAQTSAQSQPGASASAPVHHTPPNTLSPKVTSEQITPTIPSPTANNTPLPPFPDGGGGGGAAATGGEDDRKKKRSKEDKKKEKEEEKRKEKEKKKDKADKESQKKEKERAEKEKKKEKGGKKKDRGGGEAEEKNGATAPRDSA